MDAEDEKEKPKKVFVQTELLSWSVCDNVPVDSRHAAILKSIFGEKDDAEKDK